MMNFRILGVFVGGFALLLAGVNAQGMAHDMAGMEMAASGAVETSSTKAFKAADAKMHKDMMATTYTGDADVDFLRGMIPHHQGAVDMANVVLQYGTDPDVKMLAGDIVKAQEKEIRWMKEWLAKHGPTVVPDAKASDTRVEVSKTAVVATVLPVSSTVPASATLTISSSMPPVDAISATTAMRIGEPTGMGATMNMPAPDAEIENAAPKMEFLDGPGMDTTSPTSTN